MSSNHSSQQGGHQQQQHDGHQQASQQQHDSHQQPSSQQQQQQHHSSHTEEDIPSSRLVSDFDAHNLTLLYECPTGLNLTVYAPPLPPGEDQFLTGQDYDFVIEGTVDTHHLDGDYILSDSGAVLAVSVMLCEIGAGFCSPFVMNWDIDHGLHSGEGLVLHEGHHISDSHIHSPNVFVRTPIENSMHSFRETVTVNIPNTGRYFAIGALQLFTAHERHDKAQYRYDVGSAADNRVIKVKHPPRILGVRVEAERFVWIVVALSGCIILLLLVETMRNLNHRVLRLCQGQFLVVFLVAALVACVGAGFMNPEREAFCRWNAACVLIPAQAYYAITVGRLWRINRVVSPVLLKQYQSSHSRVLSDLISFIASCGGPSHNNYSNIRLRMKVTESELARVVVFFTLPQVITQIVALIIQPRNREIKFNAEGTVGRYTCSSGVPLYKDALFYGVLQLAILSLFLLAVAYGSQDLPSLFVERGVIYSSTALNAWLLLIGGTVIFLSNGAESSPEIEYLAWVALIVSSTLNMTARIMVPKLQLVWRNERVLVSRLVCDSNQFTSSGAVSSEFGDSVTSADRRGSQSVFLSLQSSSHPLSTTDWLGASRKESEVHTRSCEVNDDDDPESLRLTEEKEQPTPLRKRSKRPKRRRIQISDDEPPSQLLVLPMVRLSGKLSQVIKGVTSGLAVRHQDWEELRNQCTHLSQEFKDNVVFRWEADARVPIREQDFEKDLSSEGP